MSKNNKIIVGVVIVVIVVAVAVIIGMSHQGSQESAAMNAQNEQGEYGSNTAQATPASSVAPAGVDIFMMKSNPKGGSYVTDSKGMSLYIFDKDTPGVSNCSGQCLVNWPPYSATQTDNLPSGYGVITRSDGTKQYTLNQMPLYYYISDKNPGDTTGDGVGGVWHLAK